MITKQGRIKRADYYARQIVLKEFGNSGLKKLARSRVAVVGLGGLGTVSSLYLALAGVGHLRLIDQDTVETSNLHRQVLYTPQDLHYPKVEASASRLEKANPFVKVEPIPENLNATNVEKLLSGVDCVVDGLDSMHARYIVNRTCVKLGIPYVFGAAVGLEGNLSVFASPHTPCLECVLPDVEDDSLSTCDVRGVLGATAGIVGTMQAMETVKVLAHMGSALKGKLMICDFSDMYFMTVDIYRRGNCSACQAKQIAPFTDEPDRLVWLCGRNTVNVNPDKPIRIDFNHLCEIVKTRFRVRVISHLAIVFDYKDFEISLFSGGRMLIKNVKDEKSALEVYGVIRRKLEGG